MVSTLTMKRCVALTGASTYRAPHQCEKEAKRGTRFCPHHTTMGARVKLWQPQRG